MKVTLYRPIMVTAFIGGVLFLAGWMELVEGERNVYLCAFVLTVGVALMANAASSEGEMRGSLAERVLKQALSRPVHFDVHRMVRSIQGLKGKTFDIETLFFLGNAFSVLRELGGSQVAAAIEEVEEEKPRTDPV